MLINSETVQEIMVHFCFDTKMPLKKMRTFSKKDLQDMQGLAHSRLSDICRICTCAKTHILQKVNMTVCKLKPEINKKGTK